MKVATVKSISLILLNYLHGANATLIHTGSTVSLDGIYYYISPRSIHSIAVPLSIVSSRYIPLTVFTTNATNLAISAAAQQYAAVDDVFQPGFLDIALIQYTGAGPANVSVTTVPERTIVVHSSPGNKAELLSQGPYFLSAFTGTLHKAYRLYSDFAGAFSETIIADDEAAQYSVLPANIPGQNLAVAVPSRLYFEKTPEKPLNGVRLGVKDIFDIKGMKTSNGNRAWYHLYPPANVTAPSVQRLINAGAVVVGKMKTSQFAHAEQATADWVDYHEPFNPRGDGYQDTSGSSAGPGAGEAAYFWLDITLGTDTGGSVRGPAGVQGIFGNRPSHGLVPLDHVMPLAMQLDTAGFLCRDPDLWIKAADVLYGGTKRYSKFPIEILTIDYPTEAVDESFGLAIDFARNLSKFLDDAPINPYDVESAFAANPPTAAKDGKLAKLLQLVYPILTTKEQIRYVRDPFFSDYAAKYAGRKPFVDPVSLAAWEFGLSQSDSEVPIAIRNQSIFAEWVATNIFPHNNESCSSRIMIYVGSTASADPRNEYFGEPYAPTGYGTSFMSSYAGFPDFVVPIGEAGSNSTITGQEEKLPVTVNMAVGRGCDGMLFDLIRVMVAKGLLKPSQPGRSLVGGGEVLF